MRYAYFVLAVSLSCSACDSKNYDRELHVKQQLIDQKEQELLTKEQELLSKEKSLIAREAELAASKHSHDSLLHSIDTVPLMQPDITGRWNVNMRCIETDCPGSAVGDEKNEQWQISYTNKAILAQAFTGDSLVREYRGTSANNAIELLTTDSTTTTRIVVTIQSVQTDKMRGQREIIRPENCHILYSIELNKL